MGRFSFISGLVLALTLMFGAHAMALETHDERLVVETSAGPIAFSAEIAATAADRATGLMNRAQMERDHGMLFVFDRARQVTMWMKNTILPLDMVFIGEDGRIAGIAADTVPFSEAIISSPGPVRYVLELNAGVAAERGLSTGDRVIHPVIPE